MSILRKPYEVSVWDDIWDSEKGKFVESRLGVIGSDTMETQSRVIEPELTRNTNGTKKFSFKLYKRYIDNITGKQVENPFYSWLANERKVKLKYDGKWYDFVIKNIVEPSSNYLYTYELEDVFVQELSKNGFNFIFDAELNNNLGTSKELAEKLLKDITDWEVGECDVPVQTIDEALVYITIPSGTKAIPIIDQTIGSQNQGVTFGKEKTFEKDVIALASYSSCTGRPHRFQFFYIEGMIDSTDSNNKLTDKILVDENRYIINKNCQYYIDFDIPSDIYTETSGYLLPENFNTTTVVENEGESGVTLSGKLRGKRYGFTQEAKYIPVLNRYVNVYEKGKEEYYGYENTEYCSPILIQNLITGSQLKSTSGWVGTALVSGENVENVEKATVEAVYGRFGTDGKFHSSIEDMQNGIFTSDNIDSYESYLKITFPDNGNAVVINSGPYDNRSIIGNMQVGDEFAVDYELHDDGSGLKFTLGEYQYDSSSGYYKNITENITFSGSKVLMVASSNYSEENFKKNSQVRLCISSDSGGTYYLKSIQLYKIIKDGNGSIIKPDSTSDGKIESTYYYFTEKSISEISRAEQLIPTEITKTLTFKTYKPKYNIGASKQRTITAKESNYFNILQTIAETFEQWLEIDISHYEDGAVKEKKINFRNYIGKENLAGFKYGVNLKDIKRTYESKKLVTKLVVKENNNEFAQNGFCTIARANANPTGENTIYDFQYFFNTGMMSARDYLETVYVMDGWSEENIQGYFPRIRDLNAEIQKKNDMLLNISKDLLQINSELEIVEMGLAAAVSGIEETREKFHFLTSIEIKDLGDIKYKGAIPTSRSDIKKILEEYCVYLAEEKKYRAEKERLDALKTQTQTNHKTLTNEIDTATKAKETLHKAFFSAYNRFIQEGTWVSEDYMDDEKYYADAQSVLYESCYPQAAYEVNVIEVSRIPGYELFTYDIGDETFVEDKEFFGGEGRIDVVVTETTDNLDDPTKNKIKVQNFKNQFKDLFQKITATVQQTQYNTGAYEKAVALAEAGQERKQQFLTDALEGMDARLSIAGQQSVSIGDDGITITDVDTPSNSIRMVGGAILLSKQDKNGEQKWTTGMTSDGISANLITAGVINAGEIAIMNSEDPTFRWDSYGISAFDATWFNDIISGTNECKFVRFDKHGIYGISDKGVNGLNWHPSGLDEINSKATFALTWEGLKVTSDEGVVATIGKSKIQTEVDGITTFLPGGPIINITKTVEEDNETKTHTIFSVSNDGSLNMTGVITATGGKIGGLTIKDGYLTSNENKQSYDSGDYSGVFVGPSGIGLGKNVFTVNKDGDLVAKNATIEGGKIANFTIKNYTISSRTNFNEDETGTMSGFYTGDNDGNKSELTNRISLIEPEINDKTNYSTVRFFAGAPFDKTAEKINEGNFVVLEDGSVYASAINITGGSISIGDGKFTVDQDGNVVLAGSITWDSSSSPVKVLYSIESRDKPVSTSKYPANSKVDWHTNFNKDEDKFASYSYDGGKTWTEAVSIVGTPGKDGKDGEDGTDGSDAYVDRAVLLGLEYEKEDGLHPFPIGDKTYIGLNATAIRTGYLGFKDSSGNSTNYYIDPFNAIENNQFYINLPKFRIAKDEHDHNSYLGIDVAKIGSVEFYLSKGTSEVSVSYYKFNDRELRIPALYQTTLSPCIKWTESADDESKEFYRLTGHPDKLILLKGENDTKDYDFVIFGTSWKSVLSRLEAVESALNIQPEEPDDPCANGHSFGGGGEGIGGYCSKCGTPCTHEHTEEQEHTTSAGTTDMFGTCLDCGYWDY